jgi:hypothetical protein
MAAGFDGVRLEICRFGRRERLQDALVTRQDETVGIELKASTRNTPAEYSCVTLVATSTEDARSIWTSRRDILLKAIDERRNLRAGGVDRQCAFHLRAIFEDLLAIVPSVVRDFADCHRRGRRRRRQTRDPQASMPATTQLLLTARSGTTAPACPPPASDAIEFTMAVNRSQDAPLAEIPSLSMNRAHDTIPTRMNDDLVSTPQTPPRRPGYAVPPCRTKRNPCQSRRHRAVVCGILHVDAGVAWMWFLLPPFPRWSCRRFSISSRRA